MKGKRIKTLWQLQRAAWDKKSVFCPESGSYCIPKPAAWVLNYSGTVLINLMLNRRLYIYKTEVK